MKLLNILTKCSYILIGIAFILSIFNIGPTTQPIYFYISDSNIVNIIVCSAMFIAFVLSLFLILLYLNKRDISLHKLGILVILINLMLDIVFGGNTIFFASYVITFILLVANTIVKKKANN